MKLKFARILLLSLFLFLLPLSVFANKASPKENLLAKEKSISIEEKAPVEKEPLKEVKTSDFASLKKIEEGTREAVENPQGRDKAKEESVAEKQEKTAKSETLASDQVEAREEAKAPVKDEGKDSEELDKLDLGDPLVSPSVTGGGSSGGSGSGYVSSSAGNNIIRIEKVDENGRPMGVAFKVTNTSTGEVHIVVTGKDGKSGEIHLAPIPYNLPKNQGEPNASDRPRYQPYEFSKEELTELIKLLKEKGFLLEDKEGPIGPLTELIVPNPSKKPQDPPADSQDSQERVNGNDKYLDEKKEVKGLYKYEDLISGGTVKFEDEGNFGDPPTAKGDIKITIHYGKVLPPTTPPDDKIHTEAPKYEYAETYVYKQKTYREYEEIGQNKLKINELKNFIKKRLAVLINQGKVKLEDKNHALYSIDFEEKGSIYKFEELRTDSNKNYSLKTFYIQDSLRNPIYMGYSEDKIDMPANGVDNLKNSENSSTTEKPATSENSNVDGNLSEDDATEPNLNISVFKVTNEKFVFETLAMDKETGEKTLPRGTSTTVIDKITFDKLSPKKAYKFVGKLIHKKTGQVVKTVEYETGKLAKADGEARVEFTFDSSKYAVGDEFVIVYDIYEDGQLAGDEKDLDNKAQSFTIKDKTTPPPKEETPPPKEETPPPKEETPPPKEETPTPKEETPPPKEETPPPKVPEKLTKRPPFEAPKTFDPGIGFSLISAITSGMALTFLKKRR